MKNIYSLIKREIIHKMFLPTKSAFLYLSIISLLMLIPITLIYSQDSYVITTDLNLRSGAGSTFESIEVLIKGDTVTLLENSKGFWVKIQHKDKIGYSAKQYLNKIAIEDAISPPEKEKSNSMLFVALAVILIAVLLQKTSNRYRYKAYVIFLSLFFGALGFQKFYLGEKRKGIYSIIFCWTFVPLLIGIIDFFKYTSMSTNVFESKYNPTSKPIQKDKASIKKEPTSQNEAANPAIIYIMDLYQKGLYLDDILKVTIAQKLQMPNGTQITKESQIKSIVRSKVPNAIFEIKNTTIRSTNSQQTNIKKTQQKKNNPESQKTDNKSDSYIINDTPLVKNSPEAFMAKAQDLELKEFAIKENKLNTIIESLRLYSENKYNEPNISKTKVSDNKFKLSLLIESLRLYSENKYNASSISYTNDDIIDVSQESYDLTVEQEEPKELDFSIPPVWNHSYVYSYDEIKHATKAQNQFYIHLKNRVVNGEYVDIHGYTNYAFILYFDLWKEYEKHDDIDLLEKQFKLLGTICSKTKSYALQTLQDELRKREDTKSVNRLKDLSNPTYQFEQGYSSYDPNQFKLYRRFEDRIELTDKDHLRLDKFNDPFNAFTSIDDCCIAVVNFYLLVLNELEIEFSNKGKLLDERLDTYVKRLQDGYAKEYGSDWEYYGLAEIKNQANTAIYGTLFKRTENIIREHYGHKRKLSENLPYNASDITEEFENEIGEHFNKIASNNTSLINNPDLETQCELNAANVNRWKTEYNTVKSDFKLDEKDKFLNAIDTLEKTNQKNPNIESIFFEATKFISKYDKEQSLSYYAKYIYYNVNSNKFKKKKLTKTVEKALFKTEEQIKDFNAIIDDLIETKDIEPALDKISKIYIPKRKRIQLDRSEIDKVEQKHEGTVELLNEYLIDDKEKLSIETPSKSNENVEKTTFPTEEGDSIFISEICTEKVQEELVKMIVLNSFEIEQNKVDKYAEANGMFKNQLIDSINQACEEHLDGEMLIEEDDDNYIIEESYYKEIAR